MIFFFQKLLAKFALISARQVHIAIPSDNALTVGFITIFSIRIVRTSSQVRRDYLKQIAGRRER
ncbi:MAG: hypothetical protein WCV63_09295 [Negativicutes bacterium]